MTITAGSGYWTNDAAVGSWAYCFDGSATLANCNDYNLVDNLDSMSVSAWAHWTGATNLSAAATVVSQMGSGNDTFSLGLAATEDWQFQACSNTVGYLGQYDMVPADVNTNNFYHIVGVKNGDDDTVKIYVNTVVGGTVGTMTGTIQTSARKPTIGSLDGGSAYWKGQLDDIRVWNRALTLVEITNLYNLGTP